MKLIELRGRVRVGDMIVRGVDFPSRKVTFVTDAYIRLDDIYTVSWDSNEEFLRIIRCPVTLENLAEGDVVSGVGLSSLAVRFVLKPGVYVIGDVPSHGTLILESAEGLKRCGYTVVQPPSTEPRVVSMKEVREKFGEDVVIE